MPRHLYSFAFGPAIAGRCGACGRDIEDGQTARTDGVDLFCSAECAGEALTREVYARADGQDELVGEGAWTLDEAVELARKYRRLRGHAMGLVLGWRRAAEYARQRGWQDIARRYNDVADELARILREIESPAGGGVRAGDVPQNGVEALAQASAPSLPRLGG